MSTYVGVWKKYAVFHGRAGRAEYWTFTLINYAIFILLGALGRATESSALGAIGMIFVAAQIVPGLAVTVRRLHDTDRSGWLILIALIPILGALALLFFMLVRGTQGENRFGPSPDTVTITHATRRHPTT